MSREASSIGEGRTRDVWMAQTAFLEFVEATICIATALPEAKRRR